MTGLNIFPSLTARQLATFAAFALALPATGAGAAESPFVAGKIEAKEIKGNDFCNTMVLEGLWATKDHISGYWRLRNSTLEASGKIDVVEKKGKLVADLWGEGSEKSVETTKRVGPDLHVKVELDWKSDVWSSDEGNCVVEFVLPDVLPQKIAAGSVSKKLAAEKSLLARLREEQKKESERLAKQQAEEEARLTKLREEQRKEAEQLAVLKAEAEQRLAKETARRADIEAQSQDAERLAKWRAEEEARFAKLREEQRKEADRLAKLKAEAEQRLAKGESLDVEFERKVRDAERLAELQSKEAARLAKLRQEQGKEAERLLRLKAEAEQRLATEETRRAQLEKQSREAERLAKQRAEEESRLAILRQEQRKEADRLAKLKTESEKKSKPDDAGIGEELKQQLAFLKNLKEAGLLDEQDFNTRKSALLNRFLGMKQSPSSLTPSSRSSKNVDLAILNEFSDIKFGKYHALVIGNNNYKHLPKLKTAKNDAESVAKILREKYNFDVSLMTNASHEDILDAFDEYRETLGYSDNLLIYYAGHGWLDEDGDQGYWLPVDAKKNRRSKWISVASVTTTLKALDANHVMVVADSCFSGTLVRGLKITEKRTNYIRRMVDKRARVVLTSGGLEPVADSGGSGHSPFANAFIKVLNENKSVMDGTGLFTKLRRTVVLSADQTPEYGDVRKAGHEGGDFLFVRKR